MLRKIRQKRDWNLLIFHYVSDLTILLHNWWFRRKEQEKYLERALLKVFLLDVQQHCVHNNFGMLLYLTMVDLVKSDTVVIVFTYSWLVNSIIPVGITFCFSHYEISRERRKLRQELSSEPAMGQLASD